MFKARRGLAALFALLALALGFSGVAAAAPENPDDMTTTTSSCTPRPISATEISAEYIRAVDGSAEFTAYEAVEFGFGLALEEGHCEGDSITFTPPAELGDYGAPINLATENGEIIAHAVYKGGKVGITLTDAVEVANHYAFEAYGWWRVDIDDTLVPGETRDLLWEIGGQTRRTEIHVGECPGCSQPGPGASKWGVVHPNDPSLVEVTLVTPTATTDAQEFILRDELTSQGQVFSCDSNTVLSQAGTYKEASVWGRPLYTHRTTVDTMECSSTVLTMKLTLNEGEKARVEFYLHVDPTDPGPWTDSATITSQERSWDTSATVRRAEAGGGASYLLKPEPTPSATPTPEPSATPTPEPSPSVTPSPTPTPEPSPTPSVTPSPSVEPSPTPESTPTPSATATPSPSATPSPKATPSASTPAPTPTVTPSPSPTPSATPSVTPTLKTAPAASPTPTRGQEVVAPPAQPPHKRPGGGLAHTGSNGDLLIKLSAGLLITGLGFGGFVEARRRRSHEE